MDSSRRDFIFKAVAAGATVSLTARAWPSTTEAKQLIRGPAGQTKFDVVIVYGQSNAVGFSGRPGVPAADASAAPEPGPLSLHYDPATNTIVPLSNTMNHLNYIDEGSSSRGNAWTAFANQYVEMTGRGVVVVNGARGGKTIGELSKGAGVGLTAYYEVLLSGYSDAKRAMISQGVPIGETYLVFHQGESDQSAGTGFINYRDALNQLIADLFTDISELHKIGVCIVGCPDSRRRFDWQRIQAAQYAAVRYGAGAGVTKNAAVIYEGCPTFSVADGQYNPEDKTHYSQRGYNQMGEGAATGLVRWARGSNRSGSPADERRRLSVSTVGDLAVQLVAAVAAYSGSWVLLRDTNTEPEDAFYPCFVDRIDTTPDAVRFVLSGRSPVTYSMSADINSHLMRRGVRAEVSTWRDAEEWGFEVRFFCDLSFAVDVSTGALLQGAPLTLSRPGDFVHSSVSARTDGKRATIVHPPVTSTPEVFYGSTTSAEPGSVGVRSLSPTETRIQSSGPSYVVNVALRSISLPLKAVEGFGAVAVRLTAHVSDTL